MQLPKAVENLMASGPLFRDALACKSPSVLASLLGPAYRGLVRQVGKQGDSTALPLGYSARFGWTYEREYPEISRLYELAKQSQWNAATDVDWSRTVDPYACELLPDRILPFQEAPAFKRMDKRERDQQRCFALSWLLSQFLHGEQGALYAAAQVTEAVPWFDAKLYGSTQVMDEGRHVEAFYTYLSTKLEKLYQINDNLYVVIDALMSDSRWDLKFLGMQIMVEGLALGAFGMIRTLVPEPLLKDVLKLVITDEARHVHFGVLALRRFYAGEISERERRQREDWAFEVSLLLRNRFLGHEMYEESYAHSMSRKAWDQMVEKSEMMSIFRRTMFKRIVPNLKAIGLLTERVRDRYEQAGLLHFESGKSAPDLTASDLMEG
jgi:hypothetical protein